MRKSRMKCGRSWRASGCGVSYGETTSAKPGGVPQFESPDQVDGGPRADRAIACAHGVFPEPPGSGGGRVGRGVRRKMRTDLGFDGGPKDAASRERRPVGGGACARGRGLLDRLAEALSHSRG